MPHTVPVLPRKPTYQVVPQQPSPSQTPASQSSESWTTPPSSRRLESVYQLNPLLPTASGPWIAGPSSDHDPTDVAAADTSSVVTYGAASCRRKPSLRTRGSRLPAPAQPLHSKAPHCNRVLNHGPHEACRLRFNSCCKSPQRQSSNVPDTPGGGMK